MPEPVMFWEDLLRQIAAMARESEIVDLYGTYAPRQPYWTREEVELWLHEISQHLLGEMPDEVLSSVGSSAVQTLTPAFAAFIPRNVIRVISATIKATSGDTRWLPAQRCTISQWHQHAKTPFTDYMRYTFMDGRIYFSGNAMRLVVLVEPELSDFQADLPILPPTGFDQQRITWVHQMLTLQDFLPGGKL